MLMHFSNRFVSFQRIFDKVYLSTCIRFYDIQHGYLIIPFSLKYPELNTIGVLVQDNIVIMY